MYADDILVMSVTRGFYPPKSGDKIGRNVPTFKFLQVYDSLHIQRGPKMAYLS